MLEEVSSLQLLIPSFSTCSTITLWMPPRVSIHSKGDEGDALHRLNQSQYKIFGQARSKWVGETYLVRPRALVGANNSPHTYHLWYLQNTYFNCL